MSLEKRTINLIALSFIGLVFFPFVIQHQVILSGAMGILLFVAFFREYNYFPISKFISNFLIVASIIFVISTYGTLLDLTPALGLLSLLAILKFFELNSKRDYFIFILMVQLLLVGQLLSVDSLFFVIYLLFVTFLFFYLMLIIQRTDFTQNSYLIFRKNHSEGIERRKILVQCFLISLPISAILFFFFPRFVVGNIFANKAQVESKTGFVNELNPGDYSAVAQDRTPIFRAKFNSEKRPLGKDLYWRGAILAKQNGFRWSRAPIRKRIDREFGETIHYVYDVDFAESEHEHIFTLDNTSEVDLYSYGKILKETGNTYRVLKPNDQYLRYRATTKNLVSHEFTDKDRNHYLQLDDKIPQDIKNFAENFKKRTSNDWGLVQQLMNYYHQNEFIYTLSPGDYDNVLGMSEFLFVRKRGFCEHYSATTATLLRLMGIPSRIVSGFQGGIYNTVGDYYIVRGEDAHAWVEAWIEGRGWTLVDPVRFIAPSRIELGASVLFASNNLVEGFEFFNIFRNNQSGIIRSIIFTFDSIYYRLNQFFLAYDREAQQNFFKNLGLEKLSRNQVFVLGVSIVSLIGLSLFLYLARKHGKRGKFFKVHRKITKFFQRRGIIVRPYDGYISMIDKLSLVQNKADREKMREVLIELNRIIYDPSYQKNERFFIFNLMRKIPR